jgi:hypothetical protein
MFASLFLGGGSFGLGVSVSAEKSRFSSDSLPECYFLAYPRVCDPGAANAPLRFARSEDRAREQHLDMLENTFGEKWGERGQDPYHHGR